MNLELGIFIILTFTLTSCLGDALSSSHRSNSSLFVKEKRSQKGSSLDSLVGNTNGGLGTIGSIPKSNKTRNPSKQFHTKQITHSLKTDWISKTINRFEGGYLYQNGKAKGSNGNPLDSFIDLAKDPNHAKKYLINLNRKVYKGGILPDTTNTGQIDEWIKNIDTVKVSIIDADINALKGDIKSKFDTWKEAQSLTPNGQLPPKTVFPNFMTDNAYHVTQLRFAVDTAGCVQVNAEQMLTKVELSTDEYGKPSHFGGLESAGPNATVKASANITSFSRQELETNAQINEKFWKMLGVPSNAKNVLLNENSGLYRSLKISADEVFEKKIIRDERVNTFRGGSSVPGTCIGTITSGNRSVLLENKCAIISKPDGEVESVLPKEFLEEYRKADENGKQRMAELVMQNEKKVVVKDPIDDDDANKMWLLVKLEEVKSHVGTVEIVGKVENTRVANGKGMESNPLKTLEEWDAKLSTVKGKVKIGSLKIIQRIQEAAALKGTVPFILAQEANLVANPFGKFFLTKIVVNGIFQGDATSLFIVGTQLRIQFTADPAVQAGIVSLFSVRKMSGVIDFVGNQAGPIGASLDIGLSVWSVTKAIQRLNKTGNKYEDYAAIADMVSKSTDIVVTAAVTALSITLPPAAPLYMADGIAATVLTQLTMAAFKATNKVNRTNREVPLLLDFEQDYILESRSFDWFGTRQPEADYTDRLLWEKSANELTVDNSLAFLEEFQNFRGVVLPSRTLNYDGGCDIFKWTEGHEQAWPCKMLFGLGCTIYHNSEQIGSGCDWRRPCGFMEEICENTTEAIGDGNYTGTECICSRSAETTFGHPRNNSMVDFRKNQTIYWERTVPKEVENGIFLCKPGNEKYVGYKVSQPESRLGYLCENAIGLLQSSNKIREGQIVLFDLGDGDDKVFLGEDDTTPNIFSMGNEGTKEFLGGGGKDEFVFDSNCSKRLNGRFNGGEGMDKIILGENCTKGEEIQIEFWQGRLTNSGNTSLLTMDFEGIEGLRGRTGQREVVKVACTTRQVMSQGGTAAEPDEVIISSYHEPCDYNVSVIGTAYTKVTSNAKTGSVAIAIDNSWMGISVDVEVHSKELLRLHLSFLNTSSSQVIDWSLKTLNSTVELVLWSSIQDEIQFTFRMTEDAKNVSIYFTEEPQEDILNSVLFLPHEQEAKPVFYHFLSKHDESLNRTGCKCMENIFDITGHSWHAKGGDKADEFILNTSKVGIIDGGGGVDSVKFHKDFNQSMVLDLGSNEIQSVENVYGLAGVPLTVRIACDTLLVATQGGSLAEPDVVIIPEGQCGKRRILVMVHGHARLIMEGPDREVAEVEQDGGIQVVANGNERKLQFELETESTKVANLNITIMVSHMNWTVVEVSRNTTKEAILVHLEGMGEWVKFNLKEDINATRPYLETPHLQICVGDSVNDTPGILIFERLSGKPKIVFQLNSTNNSSESSSVKGFNGIENIFRLNASDSDWEAIGGNVKDIFVTSTREKYDGQYTIDGGGGNDNILIIDNAEKDSKGTFIVNLTNSEMGFLTTPPERRGKLVNIQHVIGSEDAPDLIYPACDTRAVNGRGGQGYGDKMDIITIGYHTCNFKLLTTVGKFTEVKNTAPKGEFTYHVEDFMTCSLEIQPRMENVHLIKFAFHPWEFLTLVGFNKSSRTMAWKLSDGQQERVQMFKLSRSPHGKEFNNPVFHFQPPGSSVSSEIRVTSEGVTMTTIQVHGESNPENVYGLPVDVNRFLINITSEDSTFSSGGVLQGCSDGSRCSANQFWIFNLASTLDLLDGGACEEKGCKNYLQFPQNSLGGQRLHVDMSTVRGKVVADQGKTVISRLRNIHELHGTQNITAYVTCDTRQVSGVGQVVIEAGQCALNLSIGLAEYTSVWFQQDGSTEKIESDNDTFPASTLHYHFITPRSFDPEGDYVAMLGRNHNYYFPFTLDSLSALRFDVEEERLFYTVNGNEYNHSMLSAPRYDEQFYTEPSMVTQDGYKLQIARDYSLWATLGNTGLEISSDSLQDLENVANSLGVTIVIQTPTEFYFIGHSKNGQDRNVLQNMANITSHLCGGGANDTIYEIVHLDNDVFIHTGYIRTRKVTGSDSKQTIDLTDVIVPIRLQSGTKYVPKTSRDGDNLVISLVGYEETNPGRVVIVDGLYPWVARRLQLLLNNALMDLLPATEVAGMISHREKRRSNYKWAIHPRPVIIPAGINVFSLSPEDLEDWQNIRFEASKENGDEFKVFRKGPDLYMTNIMTSYEKHIKTVIISDFFQPRLQSKDKEIEKERMPALISEVIVNFPGLKVMLNNSLVINITVEGSTPENSIVVKPISVEEWKEALIQVEETLLETMPEVDRVFFKKPCSSTTTNIFTLLFCDIWYEYVLKFPQFVVAGACLIILCGASCLFYRNIKGKWGKDNNVIKESSKVPDHQHHEDPIPEKEEIEEIELSHLRNYRDGRNKRRKVSFM